MESRDKFLAKLILTLTCSKCTRTRSFYAIDAERGREDVARAGWVKRGELVICPRCPQSIEERAQRVKAASAR